MKFFKLQMLQYIYKSGILKENGGSIKNYAVNGNKGMQPEVD